jgi:pyrimidine operon attenuation protein/uracil phosphoribosyltransferase
LDDTYTIEGTYFRRDYRKNKDNLENEINDFILEGKLTLKKVIIIDIA